MLALRKRSNGSIKTCWDAWISSSIFATRVIFSKTVKYVEYYCFEIKNTHFLTRSTLPTALFLKDQKPLWAALWAAQNQCWGCICVWTSQWWERVEFSLWLQFKAPNLEKNAQASSKAFKRWVPSKRVPTTGTNFVECNTVIVNGTQRTLFCWCRMKFGLRSVWNGWRGLDRSMTKTKSFGVLNFSQLTSEQRSR